MWVGITAAVAVLGVDPRLGANLIERGGAVGSRARAQAPGEEPGDGITFPTLPILASTSDVSPFFCRDVSSNDYALKDKR